MGIHCMCLIHATKVFKPGPDRTVRPEKPRTVHFCGSFSIKNRSMSKKQGPVLTAVGPHGSENRDQTGSHGSLLPIEFEPKKKEKKNTEKEKKKKTTMMKGWRHEATH